MSLAQPTLNLLLLDEVSKLNNTLMSLAESVKELTSKFEDLSCKVDSQESKLDNILKKEVNNNTNNEIIVGSINNDELDQLKSEIKSIQSNTEIDNKNINLNRTEIENLYKLVHILQSDHNDNVTKIAELKNILEIINKNHTNITFEIMNTMNSYIKELQDKNTTYSSIVQKTTQRQPYNTNTHNYTRRRSPMNSQKESPVNSDNEGWHTVRSKRRTKTFNYNS